MRFIKLYNALNEKIPSKFINLSFVRFIDTDDLKIIYYFGRDKFVESSFYSNKERDIAIKEIEDILFKTIGEENE